MPVKVIKNLPAIEDLRADNIFVMDSERARSQNIRPLNLLVVNLMPRKTVTETQLLRLLSNTPLQIDVDFLYTATHEVKNTQQHHLDSFYKSFDEVRAHFYDGMIVTGAPVEQLEFEEVDYWEEFLEIMDWSKSHVYSTLHICWGAQAGLYARYGIEKVDLSRKLCGIYENSVENPKHPLFRGFNDSFFCPHSRYTASDEAALSALTDFEILSKAHDTGLSVLTKSNLREVYLFGHLEYDRETLSWEYHRDKAAGLEPDFPENYFPEDDDTKQPRMTWSSAASLFFSNWLNYAVYQGNPYVVERLSKHLEADYDFNNHEN
ncbi:homoserine O-succinyltransferase [Lactococcus protaetiae]|uniref:Homoserine O-acetyltransferase n=1 Tax=Lactococcus protaetiae TaxID=2592653 RepID=A0A514Z5V2_9LACT|nr:homoserine O-succinyltransferase [Lactococcus protaetiae]QDK69877.1 homoserine O-succinyltransferase [Lactococcus protaetiae]